MAAGRRIARVLSVALITATSVIASAAPTQADNISCNPQDVWNDFSNAWSSVPTCAAACASGLGCFAAVVIAEGLAAAQAGNQPGASQFCGAVQNAQNAVDKATTIVGDLEQAGVPQSLLQSITDALGAVADPLAAAECACDETNAIASLANAVGSCIEAGVCYGVEAFGGQCGCTQPPTTVQGSCPPILAGCSNWVYQSQLTGCYDQNSPNYNSVACFCERAEFVTIAGDGTSPPLVQINTPSGTEILQGDLSCGTSWACFCPAPMTVKWTCDAIQDPTCSNGYQVWYCACPSGTTPDPSGKTACVCPNGQPANLAQNSFLPMCGCAPGQTDWHGQCVPACATNNVRTPDGNCCDPDQVTYCGQCCPSGSTPDLVHGTCSSQKIQ
jgi:hypothetical protein